MAHKSQRSSCKARVSHAIWWWGDTLHALKNAERIRRKAGARRSRMEEQSTVSAHASVTAVSKRRSSATTSAIRAVIALKGWVAADGFAVRVNPGGAP